MSSPRPLESMINRNRTAQAVKPKFPPVIRASGRLPGFSCRVGWGC
jgi:hypothetical protein